MVEKRCDDHEEVGYESIVVEENGKWRSTLETEKRI
jgi:hypothetical protein